MRHVGAALLGGAVAVVAFEWAGRQRSARSRAWVIDHVVFDQTPILPPIPPLTVRQQVAARVATDQLADALDIPPAWLRRA